MTILAAAAAATMMFACGEKWSRPPDAAIAPAAAIAPTASRAPSTLPPAAAPVPAAVTGPRDPLFGQIPHDTPYLFIPRDLGLAGLTQGDALVKLRTELRPLLAAVSDDLIAQMQPHERLGFAAVRMLFELDTATLRRIGLGDPKRRGALYGLGLVPVLRLEVDGKLLRDHLVAAAQRVQIPKPFEDWRGHAYVRWPIGSAAVLVAMLRDDQLVLAIVRQADDVLPHLAGAAAPPVPLDEDALMRAGGVTGELMMWIDPARAAALLAGTGDGALPALTATSAGCGAALAPVIGALPPLIGATKLTTDRFTTRVRIGPVPTLAAELRPLVRPITHWPAEPPPPRTHVFGMGVSVLPFVGSAVAFADELGTAAVACGGARPEASMRLALLTVAAALASVRGFTITGDLSAPVPWLVGIADVTEPAVVYDALSSPLGLPARPPPLDKARAFKDPDGGRGSLTLHRNAISGWLGRRDAAALAALRAAPSGPPDLARIAGGGDPRDRTSAAFDAALTLDGDHLVFDYSSRR